jgi:hypothetical protein
VNDNLGYTSSIRYDVNVVYPTFYGSSKTFSSTQSVVQSLLGSFTKIVNDNINQTVPFIGTSSCIYYCVPAIYNTTGTVSSLYDTSSPSVDIKNILKGTGTAFTMSLSSPTSMWASTVYNCYIYSPLGTASIVDLGYSPFYAVNYQFNF